MPKCLDRRQFLKHGSAAALGFATFSLVSLGYTRRASGQLKLNVPSETIIADLESRIPALMSKMVVPGVSFALVKNGKIAWSQGFGVKNTRNSQRVDPNTIFMSASLSKPLFAYAVLKMAERGELDLDQPLTAYTAKPYISDSRIKLITARMVLSHTTGFPNWSGNAPVWINHTPGTRFGYSGEGYLYLQRVVERITGQPLGEYMSRYCLDPLGMNSSSYIWRESYDYLAANGHDRQGNPQAFRKPREALSAGSLRTTATDFAKFLIAMMQSGTKDRPQLTSTSVEQMLQPQVKLSPSLSWGLGWGLEATPEGDFFWHWGDNTRFKSFTLASRNLKTGIVLLTNGQNGLKICKEIVRRSIGGQHPAFDFGMINY